MITITRPARTQVQWAPVGIFTAIAFAGAYALDALIAVTGGLGTPVALILILLRMFTPALATVIVCRWITHEKWFPAVNLGRATFTQGRWKTVLGSMMLGTLMVVLVVSAATGLAITAGWFSPDWTMSTTFKMLADTGAGELPSPAVLGILLVIQAILAGLTINGIAALGEEVGWRGWLHNALLPLGPLRMIMATGVIWGLWHAPLVAMGYNYDHQLPAPLAVLMFTAFCTAFGAILTWLTLCTGSVVPAAAVHGVFNAFATLPAVLVAPDDVMDLVWESPLGIPAILLFAVLAVGLFSRRVKPGVL